MPKIVFNEKDYSPKAPFSATNEKSKTVETFKYLGLDSEVKMWLDFADTPTDRSIYNGDISSIAYEGSATVTQQAIGKKTYNTAIFDDSENINALVTFDSTTNALSFGDGSTTDVAFSASLFYKRDTSLSSGTVTYLFGKSAGTAGDTEFYARLLPNSNLVQAILYDNNTSNYLSLRCTLLPSLYDNQWCHIVFTYDGSSATGGTNFYANGEVLAKITDAEVGTYQAMHREGDKLYVGASPFGGIQELDGNIAELLFIQKELTQQEVRAVYYGTIFGADGVKSGYLGNPSRVQVRSTDNQLNTRPRIKRIGDKSSSFTRKPYNDENTIVYGKMIKAEFNLEANNLTQYNRDLDAAVWKTSNRFVQVKKEDIRNALSTIPAPGASGAVSLIGDTTGESWVRTQKKVFNPTLKLSVLMGEYSFNSPRALNIAKPRPGAATSTLAVQVSSSKSGPWETIVLSTKNISNENVKLTADGEINASSNLTEQSIVDLLPRNADGEIRPVFTIKIDSNQLKLASDPTAAFYIRIINKNAPTSPRKPANFAIDKIEIFSREQSLVAQTGLQRTHSDYLTSSIATPNKLSGLVINNSNILSQNVENLINFNEINPVVSAYKDTSDIIVPEKEFYQTTIRDDVLPGFSGPLSSRKVLEINLTPSQPTEFGNITPMGSTNAGEGGLSSGVIDDSEDGQQLMVYWNNVRRVWEKRGRPLNYNNTSGTATGLTAISFLSQSCLGFGGVPYFMTGSGTGNDAGYQQAELLSRDFYASCNKPITSFGFPFAGQYHATSSQYILAKDLGITKPFVLEKCVMDLDVNMRIFWRSNILLNIGGYTNLIYYGGTSDPPTSQLVRAGQFKSFTPSFFMLRQYPDSFEKQVKMRYTAASATPSTGELTFNAKIPGHYYLNSGSDTATYIQDSRELITYGQFQYFVSSSHSTHASSIRYQPSDFFAKGLSADLNIVRDMHDGATVPNRVYDSGKESYIFSESLRLEFPVRNCAAYPDRFAHQIYDESQGHTTPQTALRGILLGKEVGSRSETDLKYPRALVNGVGPINKGSSIIIPDPKIPNTDAAFIATVAKAETLERPSPYVIFPDDKLILGWQFPPNSTMAQMCPGSDSEMFRESMELIGNSRLMLYGTEVKMSKHTESLFQQNLTSDVVYEIVGDEPVVDQFELAIAGELTGSINDNFVISVTDATNKIIYGSSIVHKEKDPNIVNPASQRPWHLGTLALNRLNVPVISLTAIGDELGADSRIYFRQIGSNLNLVDTNRLFKDARLFELEAKSLVADGTSVLQRPSYGSSQNLLGLGNSTDVVLLGGKPKYYFSGRSFGQYSGLIRQGLDGTFVDDPTTSNDNIFTSSPVTIQFVSGTFDPIRGIKSFSRISPPTIDGTSEEEFQCSNISLNATSSLPYIDDGLVHNRTFSSETIEII